MSMFININVDCFCSCDFNGSRTATFHIVFQSQESSKLSFAEPVS